ncbi:MULTISPECIES: hypothetical protein [Candidatus Ichthyocystis]|uniref:hypothetical protein n=1 Tax=Candidatus Ichthyocystis TaxID=2929841 RepID=UPI000B8422CB|nr:MULTISPECIES: hypothetical protein [Ichthyocystis]
MLMRSFICRFLLPCLTAVAWPVMLLANDVSSLYELGSYPVLVNLSIIPEEKSGEAVENYGDTRVRVVVKSAISGLFHRRGLLNDARDVYAPFCSTVRIVSFVDGLSVAPIFRDNLQTYLMLDRVKHAEFFYVEPLFYPDHSSVQLVFHLARDPSIVLSSPTNVKQSGLLSLDQYHAYDRTQMWVLHSNINESVSILSTAEPGYSVSTRGRDLGGNLFLSLNGALGFQQAWLLVDSRTSVDCTQYLLNLFAQPYFLDIRWGKMDRWLRLDFYDRKPFLNWRRKSDFIDETIPQFVFSYDDRYTNISSFSKKLRLSSGDCLVPAWRRGSQDVSLYSLSCADGHASVWRYGSEPGEDFSKTQVCVKHLRRVFCLGAMPDPKDSSVHWLREKVDGRLNPYTILYFGHASPQMSLGSRGIALFDRDKTGCSHGSSIDGAICQVVSKGSLGWFSGDYYSRYFMSGGGLCMPEYFIDDFSPC